MEMKHPSFERTQMMMIRHIGGKNLCKLTNNHFRMSMTTSRFTCDLCLKRFGTKGSLKTHMRIHSGEKPFVCPSADCESRFTQQANLGRHIKLIHADDAKLHLQAKLDRQKWSMESKQNSPRKLPPPPPPPPPPKDELFLPLQDDDDDDYLDLAMSLENEQPVVFYSFPSDYHYPLSNLQFDDAKL